jgi:DNA adenine methylase
VQIENRPATDIINLYDNGQTLFYCDPPYPHQARRDSKAYEFEMSEDDHQELAAVLEKTKGKVAVSGYRCDLMDTLYDGWRRVEAPSKKIHSSKGWRTEALWLNYWPIRMADAQDS